MIENNKNLFYAQTGLILTGANAYDRNDAEVADLAGKIADLHFNKDVVVWFSRSKTGQVEVNPYWPRGSALSVACFFINNDDFNTNAFFSFLESAAFTDPVGIDDFRAWIISLPDVLSYIDALPDARLLWDDYCKIINARVPKWNNAINEAAKTLRDFFGGSAPEIGFAPNLFSCYSVDFVRVNNKIITIAAEPDIEIILHETLHTAVAVYREKIIRFANNFGLSGLADRKKMIELGYMADDSSGSAAHAIEECFVRAISAVLAGESGERLNMHSEFGFNGAPLIAARFKNVKPIYNNFGTFIDKILSARSAL